MISTDLLDKIAGELRSYRGDGRDLILFDNRDRGNYGDYDVEQKNALLRRNDPTNLAEALLLFEKIEATIDGSKVRLSRVLCEDGYLEQLQKILKIRDELDAVIAEPRSALRSYLGDCLQALSNEFGQPTDREVAICLRDAIFCLDKGLTLRWLLCEPCPAVSHLPLCPQIGHFENLPGFTDALRSQLAIGVHLARIGQNQTAIGFKQPGRIAYLSCLNIDTHTGQLTENLANAGGLPETFDIDHPVERYPDWRAGAASQRDNERLPARSGKAITHISELTRDRLIWLAMLAEMTCQRIAATEPENICLAESSSRALSCGASSLPLVLPPNWTASELSLTEMVASLGLKEWEARFIAPALDGVTIDTFMPVGSVPVGLDLKTLALRRWPNQFDKEYSYSESQAIIEGSVKLVPMAANWVGTREEIEAARKAICGRNLANWLLEWGNARLKTEWQAYRPVFEKLLRGNLETALAQSCTFLVKADFSRGGMVHLYSQSPKHKTYQPRCVFNVKCEVADIAYICPESSQDLLAILGLKKESQLPEFLRGWQRELGWTTSDPFDRSCKPPYYTTERWAFSAHLPRGYGEIHIGAATVCLGLAQAARFNIKPAKSRHTTTSEADYDE